MADTASDGGQEQTKTSSAKPLLFIIGGCFLLLLVVGVVLSVAGGFLLKTAGRSFVQKAIEQKTGVKTDLSGLEQGKLQMVDQKSGAKIDIGGGKIPDGFPKDFPIYPGAKVTSGMSGSQKGESSGFWVTLGTPDSLDGVAQYYKRSFKENGWEEASTYTTGEGTIITVQKGAMAGSITYAASKTSGEQTQIVIILGQDKKAGQATPTPTPEVAQ